MNKFTIVAIIIIVACFGGLVAWSALRNSDKATDYTKYDSKSIIAGNDDNGGIADHVRGKEDAKVVVVEYADLQCPGCATLMPRMTEVYEEYGNQVAFIFRNFPINGHQNARAASAAAESAGFQGYYWPMIETLYSNRADWISESGSTRTDTFLRLFKEIAPEGDTDKFISGMSDPNIEKKVNFDYGLGRNIDKVGATPAIYVNGDAIDVSEGSFDDVINKVKKKIDEKLAEVGK